ncbi:Predicted small lipoprotein YifL [Izhakiella capsodis]|uniref:LPS-assembly lipoprotein LptM n=1 Tax=Izhakiella capsodis TaxID=1367852 RepID=A0A1I4ZLM8_9GAMM|nr:lipoprotein [Izhakiella capsodis]SFN51186.1 Predicted small lipoprotein YifL [Izhakiella capsodis]
MKTIIYQAAMALALLSLVGCGLKGPLYFPPEKQPAQSQTDQKTSVQQDGTTTTADRGAGVGISQ